MPKTGSESPIGEGGGEPSGVGEETSETTVYDRRLDAVDSDHRNAAAALLQELEDNEVVTAREFTSRVYPDQPAGYDSKEEWWAKFARPYLEEHEAIEQLDSSARRWGVREPGPAPEDDG